jgi:hypothetical protein
MPKAMAKFRDDEEAISCYGKYIAVKGLVDNEVLRDEKGKPIADFDPAVVLVKIDEMGYEDSAVFYFSDPKVKNCYPDEKSKHS